MSKVIEKHLGLLLAIGIVLCVISPFVFTRQILFQGFDFSTTGNIGDTIGGITAPIINLLGAILIYISFQKQVESNDIQRKALKDQMDESAKQQFIDRINSLYAEWRDEYYRLVFIESRLFVNGNKETVAHTGQSAIDFYKQRIEQYFAPSILIPEWSVKMIDFDWSMKYLFYGMESIFDQIDKSNLNNEEKRHYAWKVYLFYGSKFAYNINEISELIDRNRNNNEKVEYDDAYAMCEMFKTVISLIQRKFNFTKFFAED
jgi:hypothetical protein